MFDATQWSSSRAPVDVFTLLERIYGAFDAIAKRKKVFKVRETTPLGGIVRFHVCLLTALLQHEIRQVETIGDCYVAVTGLPNTQPRHAVIMVRFAADCLKKMQELTEELATTLGSDTRDLVLRCGIHSGATTGKDSVLRTD